MRMKLSMIDTMHQLITWSAAVQEPCILAMLRIVADSEGVPADVRKTVSEVSETGARHIRHVSGAENFGRNAKNYVAMRTVFGTQRR